MKQLKLYQKHISVSPKSGVTPFCFSYLSITMIRHQDQGNLEKTKFIWSCSSRGVNCIMAEQSKWVTDMADEQELSTYIVNHKQEAKKVQLKLWKPLKSLSSPIVTLFLQQVHIFWASPNSAINQGKSISNI